MKPLQGSCLLLLICLSSFGASASWDVDWNIQAMRKQGNSRPLLLKVNASISFKCDRPLGKRFSGIIDIYSVDYHGYHVCNATQGRLLGSLKCGPKHNKAKALDIIKGDAETYYFIGFARKQTKPNKPLLLGGTCSSHKSKLMIHFCDPVLTSKGASCNMESCPLSLGLEDGRIKDEQISASSKLDNKHTAKQGRVSHNTVHDSAWCAAPTFDLRSQYLQVDLRKIHAVSAVSTQGAIKEKSWVSGYLVHYSLDGTDWIVFANNKGEVKEFKGNKDQSSVVRHWLKPHFYARFVRFVPLSWTGQRCMRVELHGCKKETLPIETLKRNLAKAPRPCEAAQCANILHSTCLMYSGKPQCKCIQSCTFELSEVCGSDGVTYQNECELKRAACLNKNQLEIAKRGPCPRTKCIPHCHKRSRPACGSDGVTYENECLLKKSACEKNKEIRIVNNGSCQEPVVCNIVCDTPHSRCVTRNGSEQTCECIDHCTKMSKPVCGSDGVTYENECLLKKSACEKNKEINIVNNGRCQEPVVCNIVCDTPHSRCVIRNGSEQTCECIDHCTKISKPVCGSDGVTYENECLLKKSACEKNKEISMVNSSSCQESFVGSSSNTLCANLSCPPYAKCDHTDTGDQCVCPSCSHSGKKVCGSDGKTYRDSCELKKHSCKTNQHIKVILQSECAALPKVAVTGQTGKEGKGKKSFGSLKTFYICMIVVAVLGVVIALAMCIFDPLKSQQVSGSRHVTDRHRDTSFRRLHNKYRVEDTKKEDI